MSISSIQELDILTEAIRLQKEFNLNKAPDNWISQFLLQLFDLFFLPFLLTIFFLILTSPWFEVVFSVLISNISVRFIARGLLFLGISYVITRLYIVNVVRPPTT